MRKTFLRGMFFSSIIVLILLNACREGILQPEELVSNPNEPVQINEQNRYSFLLNAVNLTIDVKNNARFSSLTSRISISIIDHSSGSINVSVSDRESVNRFNYSGNMDESLFTDLPAN